MNPFYTLVADRAAATLVNIVMLQSWSSTSRLKSNMSYRFTEAALMPNSISLSPVAPAISVKELVSVESILSPILKFVCFTQGKTNGTTISK